MEIKTMSWQGFIAAAAAAQAQGLTLSNGVKIGMNTLICQADGEPSVVDIPSDGEIKRVPFNLTQGMGAVVDKIAEMQADGWYLVADSGLRPSSFAAQANFIKVKGKIVEKTTPVVKEPEPKAEPEAQAPAASAEDKPKAKRGRKKKEG